MFFGHLDINLIRNKFESFQEIIQNIFDIFLFRESKIDSSFLSQQFSIPEYRIFQKDCNTHGGGLRNVTSQCECKNYGTCKRDCSWSHSISICENDKYLKSIADTSVIVCDEIMSVMDIVLTNMINTTATNISTNCHTKKIKYKVDCYILHTVLLVIILLLIITIVCFLYSKHRSKHKETEARTK